MARLPRKPLVAVVGATGTGKSQLAVEIARKFNGEIINGDAMQLYNGLPIITNKVTEEEMKGVPHHLLGVVGLEENTWTVERFVKRAKDVIEDIRQRGRLPILVGGTHYYTQSLVFDQGVKEEDRKPDHVPVLADKYPILNEPSSVILAKLREVDPVMADRWHPNDHRKIQRSLEIYLQTGRPASQIYDEQRQRRASDPTHEDALPDIDVVKPAARLTYDPLVFWINVPPTTLPDRLSARVDKMLASGLLSEVQSLDAHLLARQAAGETVDRTRGIWISIGYKEFETYQALTRADPPATVTELEKAKAEAVDLVKIATRQYAKSQVKWIRTKLTHAFQAADLSERLYLLDGSDISTFSENVEKPALELTERFLAGVEEMPLPASLGEAAAEMLSPKSSYDLSTRPDLWQRKTCEACGTVSVTEEDWMKHVKGRRHQAVVKRRARTAVVVHDASLDDRLERVSHQR
ncbi:tRNA isopentenyltransferase [Pseudovirgaria hyperparasitica]|uniref:tRNA dimethylallyltransferase n=1 Tax=Pseudovirgaria hyperparasitica TaxID=470096 RepID=A0A6A6WAW0_9PEZI|nr:tRNA isopentenyltransferase [Pseudovirgaria hyperparasitica]KAF2759174.1 tRNA isopentenyltransferase [Pseudovirgaria hyperparasitica]